jgi:CDP-diacylglycerol--serine O-phosphatidyltransferase
MTPIVRRGIYVIPSLITLGNLSAGIVSILLASQGHLTSAAWAIIAGMIMDIMDGRVARWTGCTSQFGVELDSLCDLVTFGVAPGILMYWLALEPLGRPGYAIAIFFAVCAALRLARFNLRAQSGEVSTYFVGLPVPAAAGILASFVLSYELFDNQEMTVKTIPLLMKRMPMFFHLVPVIVLGLSLLMISTIRYNNFKKLKLFRPRSLQTLGVVVVGLLLIFTYPQNVIFIVFSLYVLSGLTSLATRIYSAQRAKRLGKLRRRSTDRFLNGSTGASRPEDARTPMEK